MEPNSQFATDVPDVMSRAIDLASLHVLRQLAEPGCIEIPSAVSDSHSHTPKDRSLAARISLEQNSTAGISVSVSPT